MHRKRKWILFSVVGLLALLFGIVGIRSCLRPVPPVTPTVVVTVTDTPTAYVRTPEVTATPEGLWGIVYWVDPRDLWLMPRVGLPMTGPWPEHEGPRIYATWLRWGSYNTGKDKAARFHVVETHCGAKADSSTAGSQNICQYIKNENPDTKLFVYMPASFEVTNWAQWISWGAAYNCRGYHGQEIDDCGWWLEKANGDPVPMHYNTEAMNVSDYANTAVCGQAYNDWYGNYLSGSYVWDADTCDWDAIRLDVAPTHIRIGAYYPWNVDQDRNSVADQPEHGIPWINRVYQEGIIDYMEDFLALEPTGRIGGNGMWEADDQVAWVNPWYTGGVTATIAMDEWFPYAAMYNKNTGLAETCDWGCHMRQYIDWMDNAGTEPVWIGLGCDWPDAGKYKSMRYGLSSVMLDDGYFSYWAPCYTDSGGYSNIEQYDEYWVDISAAPPATDWDKDNLGYCGQPIAPAYALSDAETLRKKITDGDDLNATCWYRQYEHCLVLNNPTGGNCTFAGLGAANWRRILGTQVPAINDGTWVFNQVTVPSNDGRVIIWGTGGESATATPGPTPTPTVTPTGTVTPTVTLTPTPTNTPTITPTPTPCFGPWHCEYWDEIPSRPGDEWEMVVDLSDETPSQTHAFGIASDATSGVILATTRGNAQVWRSLDDGDSWAMMIDLSTVITPQTGIDEIAYDANNDVFALGTYPNAQIWRTVNDGVGWTMEIDISQEITAQTNIRSIAYDVANDVWIAGTSNDAQIWRSTDAADTWTFIKDLSNDATPGQTHVHSLTYDRTNDVWYAGTQNDGQIWMSTDAGLTWAMSVDLSNETPSQIEVLSLVHDVQHDCTFAGTYPDGQIWRTIDQGTTWQLVVDLSNETPSQTFTLSLEYNARTGRVIAGTHPDGQIWYSDDGGDNWTLAIDLSDETPSQTYVLDLDYYASDEHAFFAGTYPDAQIWRSETGGCWDDICTYGTGLVMRSGAFACAFTTFSYAHYHDEPAPTPGIAYVSHDVAAGDEGEFQACFRATETYTTSVAIMRSVEISNTNPCTGTLNSVWRLEREAAGTVRWHCDVCNPTVNYAVGTLPNDTWVTWRVKWDLPEHPGTGSVEVWREGVKLVDVSGLPMKTTALGYYQAEAIQLGILEWDSYATGPTWFYTDEAYDYYNTATCTPTRTPTATPTPTPTPTPTVCWANVPTGCWTTSNENVPAGDWDGIYLKDPAVATVSRSNLHSFIGTYSYRHSTNAGTGSGHADVYNECDTIGHTGNFTGHVRIPDSISTNFYTIWAAYKAQPTVSGPYEDPLLSIHINNYNRPAEVYVRCSGWYVCDKEELWYTGVTVTATNWYTYHISWDLPMASNTGRVQLWLDDVLVVNELGVETADSLHTRYIYVGAIDIAESYMDWYMDDFEDCVCEAPYTTVTCTPTSPATSTPTATTGPSPTPTPTITPYVTVTPTPAVTRAIFLPIPGVSLMRDTFLCYCDCPLTPTPTVTPTPVSPCSEWETGNEDPVIGDWDSLVQDDPANSSVTRSGVHVKGWYSYYLHWGQTWPTCNDMHLVENFALGCPYLELTMWLRLDDMHLSNYIWKLGFTDIVPIEWRQFSLRRTIFDTPAVFNQGNGTLYTGTDVFMPDVWYEINFTAYQHDTAGWFRLTVNGDVWLEQYGIDTYTSVNPNDYVEWLWVGQWLNAGCDWWGEHGMYVDDVSFMTWN